ncbi:MAG: tetratricopeptide repeat protein [Candidatus Omnitrophota bacterium]|nr:tetratricopeptide repeat protein [Candidatus Omnitrophota bacterium]
MIRPQLILTLVITLLAVSCARQSQSFYFGTYSDAEDHYRKGEYAKAIKKYEEYIDNNPAGNLAVIASFYTAKSYRAIGETEKAKDYFRRIAENHPSLVWADFSKTQLQELDQPVS